MKNYLLVLVILMKLSATGQTQIFPPADTIIVYDLHTQNIDTILPTAFDSSITFDKTSSYIGSMGNQVPLSLTPPTSNLFTNSNFSQLARAELSFNVTDYPIRTAMALRTIVNDTSYLRCSSMMVAPDFALVAGHCVYWYFGTTPTFYSDSLFVSPAYDNGAAQASLPTSMVDKVYIFKSLYDQNGSQDIALLHLEQPIGYQIGWTGIAFSSDTSYFTGKVFHKFSYPAANSWQDTTKHYNGDSLYYNYGYIYNNLSGGDLGINSPNAEAIPGQSGSTFMYTDNNEYYSFGVATFSYFYRHYQIKNDVFYRFKNILDNYVTAVPEAMEENDPLNIYPNPFNTYTTIQLNKSVRNADLAIYNMYGQQVKQMNNISGKTITFYRENLASGIYVIQLTEDGKTHRSEKLVISEN